MAVAEGGNERDGKRDELWKYLKVESIDWQWTRCEASWRQRT